MSSINLILKAVSSKRQRSLHVVKYDTTYIKNNEIYQTSGNNQ